MSLIKLLYLIFMFWLNLPEGVDGPSRVQLLQLSSQGRDKLQLLIPLVLQTHNSMHPAIHLQLDTRRVLPLPCTVQYVQMVPLFPLHLSACLFVFYQRQYGKFHRSHIFVAFYLNPGKVCGWLKMKKFIFFQNARITQNNMAA